jgi:hypothetical protein
MSEEERFPLGFTKQWIDLGIITRDELEHIVTQYETNDDKNQEHYRWRVFDSFLNANRNFDELTIRQLYQLTESDPDAFGAGQSMMVRVLGLPGCPIELLMKTANGNKKSAAKIANRLLDKLKGETAIDTLK